MEFNENEKQIKYSHKPLTGNELKKIMDQMNKYICKIKTNSEIGTGFFCHIPLADKIIPVLITSNHLINQNYLEKEKTINIILKDEKGSKFIKITIDNKRKRFSNPNYDITILEILEEDNIKFFLDLDEDLFSDNSEISYESESIYIIQYPRGEDASVSFSILKSIENYDIIHLCSTEAGSSGSPILKLSTKKVIGIHKECNKRFEFNRGTFLKEPLIDFIDKYENKLNNSIYSKLIDNSDYKNKIKIHLRIEYEDINKKVYFIGNDKSRVFEYSTIMEKDNLDILQELNESNTILSINGKLYEYKPYFIPSKEGNYNIILKTKIDPIDCSYMFYKCQNITNIDLSSFSSERLSKMQYMFYECTNLMNVDFSYFNTVNVNNMEFMFYGCKNLRNLDLSSFKIMNTKKVNLMFDGCQSLKKLKIPEELYLKMSENDKESLKRTGATRQLV